MKHSLAIILSTAFLAASASAQGAGGGGKQTIAEQIKKESMAGAGYVQKDFLGGLGSKLTDAFGKTKGEKYLETLSENPDVSPEDLLDLMNGEVTESEIQKMFGAPKSDSDRLEKCVKDEVKEKNKCVFFGIVVVIAVCDFGVDPTADFAKQICGSREEITDEEMQKLQLKNFSKKTIEECFGFKGEEDQDFMQQILNALGSSPFLSHPLAKSLGMAGKKAFSRDDFPKLGEGMPGFGGEFESGEAGGCPFPKDLPPCPFFGENLGALCGGSAEEPAPEGAETE